LAGKRILAVDDSPTVLTFLKSMLDEQGAHVAVAENGAQGLALHQSEGPFDLVLLDLLLPDLHGVELLQRMRASDKGSSIVMLTGYGEVRTAIAAVQSGADGYIQKEDLPANGDSEEFVYNLEQAMHRRQGIVAQAELERVKADFCAMVAHDMRNPTNTISIALEVLEDSGNIGVNLGELSVEFDDFGWRGG
jgi:DNA-binding response OmpR family regulator